MKDIAGAKKTPGVSAWPSFSAAGLPLERESMAFLVANVLDVCMTRALLFHDHDLFFESNPVARYVLENWGFDGLVWFKLGIVVFVIAICQIIARQKKDVARRLLQFATLTLSGVVFYSLFLLFFHT